jgi:hypothetical protein
MAVVRKEDVTNKILFIMLALVMLSGCALKKHCYILPESSVVKTVATGSVMLKKWECFGRVYVTARDCTEPLELIYLGRTHPGNYIRIASSVGIRTHIMAETTYPENSKLIQFKEAQIEVIEASDHWIRFKLIDPTISCDTVNGLKVK